MRGYLIYASQILRILDHLVLPHPLAAALNPSLRS